MLDYLQQDPLGFLLFMIYRAPAVLLALTFHEVAHGYVALRCGDPTAKLMHRLSLNPVKHLAYIRAIAGFCLYSIKHSQFRENLFRILPYRNPFRFTKCNNFHFITGDIFKAL